MTNYLLWASIFAAVAPVVSIRVAWTSVRGKRGDILDWVSKTFHLTGSSSYEFAKLKYGGDPDDQPTRGEEIFEMTLWTLAAVPLMATLLIFSAFTFAEISQSCNDPKTVIYTCLLAPLQQVRWVIVAGFCAAYLNAFTNLLRSVRNFDLNPLSFIDSALDILLGIFTGIIFYYCFKLLGANLLSQTLAGSADQVKLPFSIIVAIAASYYPDVVKRYIVRMSNLNYIKIEKTATFTGLELITVEVIDGIDSSIRKRLEDYYINCVENLAVANPILMFVETPYGLYALLDWIGQAQLFSTYGVAKAAKLLELGIRTLLDLEPFALEPDKHPAMVKALGDILLNDAARAVPVPEGSPAPVVDSLNAALSALHVRRLRQVVKQLRAGLDV